MQKCACWRLSVFMARRLPSHKKRKYKIIWNDRIAGHVGVVSRETWKAAIASGWIVPMAEECVAVVAFGVKVTFKNGMLWLEDTYRKALIWIYTSWIAIDRNSPVIEGDYWKRELLKQYGNIKSHRPEPVGDDCKHPGEQCPLWVRRLDWEAS